MARWQYQAHTEPVAPVANVGLTIGWFIPLSEPVRIAARLLEASQQFLAYSESARFPESVTEDRWHQPWSEPVRQKPRLLEPEQQFSPLNPFGMTRPETPQYDKFGFPWSEPVRTKPRLIEAAQSFFAPDPAQPTQIGWFAPLTEPVRLKPRLPEPEQPFVAFEVEPPVFDTMPWFDWLSEPVRLKPGLRAEYHPVLALYPFPIEAISLDKWFQWFSDPVRTPARLMEANQPVLAYVVKLVPDPLFAAQAHRPPHIEQWQADAAQDASFIVPGPGPEPSQNFVWMGE